MSIEKKKDRMTKVLDGLEKIAEGSGLQAALQSAADQIVTLERQLEQADDKIFSLEMELKGGDD